MKDNTPDEIKQALEYLLHTVAKYKGAVVVGYLFSADPLWITTVSNVKEGQFIETVETVHNLAKTKIKQGLVIANQVKQAV